MQTASAQPCGCDVGARWMCEQHREDERDLLTILVALKMELTFRNQIGLGARADTVTLWLRDVEEALSKVGA